MFTISHQNVRSLNNKTKRLEALLLQDLKCDVLAISEHWLTLDKLKLTTISNYTMTSNYCRPNIEHGGTCIFVKNNFRSQPIDLLCKMSVEQVCEVSAVRLIDIDFVIVCIYRSNLTHCNEFFPVFESLLDRIFDFKFAKLAIVGDFNIDTMVVSNHRKRLLDILSSHDLVNIVDFPTRISGSSCTSLDHVMVWRGAGGAALAAPVTTHLSDHLAVRTRMDCAQRDPPPITVTARDMSRANKMRFVAGIRSIDWEAVYTKPRENIDDLADCIVDILHKKFISCFPMKHKTIKFKYDNWISQDVLNMKRLLFNLLDINSNIDDPDLQRMVSMTMDRYDRMLSQERTKHLSTKINGSDNKCKAMWSVVNAELGRATRSSLDFTDLVKAPDGSVYASKRDLLDAMNERFVGAATTCGAPRADLPASGARLGLLCPSLDQSFRFKHFSAREVLNIITKKIPRKKSKDIYEMSCELLSLVADSVSPALSILYNRCIREGIFPTSIKRVKISPVYKGKGKKEDGNDYRPVAIIPTPAKVLENGISARLTEFLSESRILCDQQFAYRAGRSTTDLAREVVWGVLRARDAGLQVAVLCCDLSKAFDVADHDVIANKLQHYGIRGPALSLLVDFMSNRNQTVVGEGGLARSREIATKIGVPQGSSLSNIIFSLLMNDLPNSVKEAQVTMYADDVAALVTGRSVDDLERRLALAATQLAEWFKCNGLALNPRKSHLMHFNLAGRPSRPLQVRLDTDCLAQVSTTCFLGFRLDSGLFWDSHIEWLCGRLGSACFGLQRLAATVPQDVTRSCYFATVQSLLTYGIELWGRAADWHRVFVMQKRAIRAMARIKIGESARPSFVDLRLMTVPSLYILHVALFVRKNMQLYKVSQRARRSGLLLAVRHKLAKCAQSVYVCGPSIYNAIPTEIRDEEQKLTTFKFKLKKWLTEQAFYTVDEFINRKK